MKKGQFIMRFALIDTGCGPYWWKIEGDRFINQRGGHTYTEFHEIIESCEADSWSDLDWTKTILANKEPDLKTGWLSPEGEFFPCSPRDHDDTAIFLIKKSVGDCESEGWIRIVLGDWRNKEPEQLLYVHRTGKQTRKQVRWLRDHGYDEAQIDSLEDLILHTYAESKNEEQGQ